MENSDPEKTIFCNWAKRIDNTEGGFANKGNESAKEQLSTTIDWLSEFAEANL